MDWSFDYCLVSFFVSFHSLCFKVYFIWYEYCYSYFLLVSIWMKYLSSSPSLSVCMCPLVWGRSLVDSVYSSLVFCIHSASLCLLVRAFDPFTFKVIIDHYDPISIYFVVWIWNKLLCFLSREDPLASVGELVWWCWIVSAFACL